MPEPFRFVVLSSHTKPSDFFEPVDVVPYWRDRSNCYNLMEAFRPDLGGRRIIVGLDTVITGALDDICGYGGNLAFNRDPYNPDTFSTGVILCDEIGADEVWTKWIGGKDESRLPAYRAGVTEHSDRLGSHPSDLAWMRRQEFKHELTNDLFPGQIVSYKESVRGKVRQGNERMVWFHGHPKPHQIDDWVRSYWD